MPRWAQLGSPDSLLDRVLHSEFHGVRIGCPRVPHLLPVKCGEPSHFKVTTNSRGREVSRESFPSSICSLTTVLQLDSSFQSWDYEVNSLRLHGSQTSPRCLACGWGKMSWLSMPPAWNVVLLGSSILIFHVKQPWDGSLVDEPHRRLTYSP